MGDDGETFEVEVDGDVFAVVQDEARPLMDDFNSALRRLLDLDEPAGNGKRRAQDPGVGERRVPPGSILAEAEYELPLLEALSRRGGSGSAAEITDAVGVALRDRFSPADLELHKSGDIRWRNRTAFTRLRLKEHGFLRSDSPRGTWEVTERGRERLSKLQSIGGSRRPRAPRLGVGRSTDGKHARDVASEPIAYGSA